MSKRTNFTLSTVLLLVLSASMPAQSAQSTASKPQTRQVVASASGASVRFSSLGEMIQLRLEVIGSSGEVLFDSNFRSGNVIDWSGADTTGRRLADGSYLCVISVKDSSGQITRKQVIASVHNQSLGLRQSESSLLSAAQAQTAGESSGEDGSLTIVEPGGSEATTVLAHDGSTGHLVSGGGGLSISSGDFFANKLLEQIRLTAEGNVGIGISNPQAKLDVAGTIRASQGIVFPDGTIQFSAASKTLGAKSSSSAQKPGRGEDFHTQASGAGTQNRIAKWTDNSGTLGDSGITETAGGFLGIGTTTPQSGLDYRNLLAPFFTRDIGTTNFGTTQSALQLGVTNAGSRNVNVGPSFLFFADNSAGAKSFLGRVSGAWENPTAGAEAGSIHFEVRANSGDTTASTERMRITASGNVGIGTSSPLRHLHVLGAGDQEIGIQSSDAGGRQWTLQSSRGANNGRFEIIDRTAGANRFTILSDGSVGIGTTAPASRLDVAGNINTSTQYRIGGLRVLSIGGFDNSNTFAGVAAGTNTTGSGNTFFGRSAGETNSIGANNSFFGLNAGSANTGNNNAFFGWGAGLANQTGGLNTFFGRGSGNTNLTGDLNTAIGADADVGSSSLHNATAIGALARVSQINSLVLGSIDGVNGATQSVSVGIGTTAPTNPFHLEGAGTATGGWGGFAEVVARFRQTTAGSHSAISIDALSGQDPVVYLSETASAKWSVRSDASNSDKFQIRSHIGGTNDPRLTIETNGNVGIGNSSPEAKLHVGGSLLVRHMNTGGHVAEIRNGGASTNADALKIFIDTGLDFPTATNNYITFSNNFDPNTDISIGAIQGNGFGGIDLVSGSGDYAEWLPRLNPAEKIQPGEIVGLYGGRISKQTRGAAQIMAVSTGPIVLGNDPGDKARGEYEKVAFIGQVMVRVRGLAQAGDFIVASGLDDGTGIAVAPECISSEQFAQAVGQAWETSADPGVKSVRVAVGLIQRDPTVPRLLESSRRQATQIAALEARLTAIELEIKRQSAVAKSTASHTRRGGTDLALARGTKLK